MCDVMGGGDVTGCVCVMLQGWVGMMLQGVCVCVCVMLQGVMLQGCVCNVTGVMLQGWVGVMLRGGGGG